MVMSNSTFLLSISSPFSFLLFKRTPLFHTSHNPAFIMFVYSTFYIVCMQDSVPTTSTFSLCGCNLCRRPCLSDPSLTQLPAYKQQSNCSEHSFFLYDNIDIGHDTLLRPFSCILLWHKLACPITVVVGNGAFIVN